jgi:hypothetical protein
MRTAIPTAFVILSLVVGCGSGSGTTPGTGGSSADGGPVEVILDGGGALAVPPDGASACPAGPCNYQTGSGCSGSTPACAPVLVTGTTTISPACIAPGTVAPGGACQHPGDCTAGYLCGGGTCRKLCCGGDWTGCDSPTEHCLQTLEYAVGSSNVPTGAMLCAPVDDCNALQPSTCTAGTSCLIADPTGATACLAPGTGTSGEPCPCQGGFTCVTPPGQSSVCVRLCAAVPGGAAPYCQANEGICTHYTRDPAGVGECQPP